MGLFTDGRRSVLGQLTEAQDKIRELEKRLSLVTGEAEGASDVAKIHKAEIEELEAKIEGMQKAGGAIGEAIKAVSDSDGRQALFAAESLALVSRLQDKVQELTEIIEGRNLIVMEVNHVDGSVIRGFGHAYDTDGAMIDRLTYIRERAIDQLGLPDKAAAPDEGTSDRRSRLQQLADDPDTSPDMRELFGNIQTIADADPELQARIKAKRDKGEDTA